MLAKLLFAWWQTNCQRAFSLRGEWRWAVLCRLNSSRSVKPYIKRTTTKQQYRQQGLPRLHLQRFPSRGESPFFFRFFCLCAKPAWKIISASNWPWGVKTPKIVVYFELPVERILNFLMSWLKLKEQPLAGLNESLIVNFYTSTFYNLLEHRKRKLMRKDYIFFRKKNKNNNMY